MWRRWLGVRTLVLWCFCLSPGVAAAEPAARPEAASGAPERSAGALLTAGTLRCDGSTIENDAFRDLIATAKGRSVRIPSGCRILVASPGPGETAFVLPSRTTIRCDDHSAGFLLVRRACSAGPLVGAACRNDAQCLDPEARCVVDGGAEQPFAHRVCGETTRPCTTDEDCDGARCRPSSSAFTIFGAEPEADGVAIVGCSFDVRQRSQDEDTGRLYGTCNGGAADGAPCSQLCTEAPGASQVACNRDEHCTGIEMGRCALTSSCGEHPDGPGDCFLEAKQPGSPAGPSPINVIDFSATRRASVEDVVIWDHVYGAFAVSLGDDGRLLESRIGVARSDEPGGIFVGGGSIGRAAYLRRDSHVEAAVLSGQQALVSGNEILAGKVGVRVEKNTQVIGNVLTCADRGAWSYRHCSEDGDLPHDERRVCASDEDCRDRCTVDGPDCTAIVVEGDQNSIVGNRIWGAFTGVKAGAGGFNTTVSSNRIMYGQGPKIDVQGSGWTIADNYLAWGSLPQNGPIVRIGPPAGRPDGVLSDHVVLQGNLLYGDKGDDYEGLVYVGFRGGAAGQHRNGLLSGNSFLMKASHVGVDLSALGAARADRMALLGNGFFGGGVGVRFPEDARALQGTVVTGNSMSGTREPLAGWSWEMGEAIGNAPLGPTDDAVHVVYLRNDSDAPLSAGTAVAIRAGGDGNAVVPATKGSSRIAGVLLADALPGATARIATGGTTRCRVEAGWFSAASAGDPLGVGEAGVLVPADESVPAVAVALGAESSPGLVRCLVD